MSKPDVQSWDSTPGNNTDINGVNIAEGCPAAGINDAIRTVMGQVATWITSATGPLIRIAAKTIANDSQISDGQTSPTYRLIGYRALPFTASTTGRTIALTDVGMGIPATGGMTVPPNSSVAFAIGDTVTIYNNSASNITITQGAGVTLRLVATATTGNRTLAQRSICTLWKLGTDEWVATGAGVS